MVRAHEVAIRPYEIDVADHVVQGNQSADKREREQEAVGISTALDPFSELILKIVKDPKFPRAGSTSPNSFPG